MLVIEVKEVAHLRDFRRSPDCTFFVGGHTTSRATSAGADTWHQFPCSWHPCHLGFRVDLRGPKYRYATLRASSKRLRDFESQLTRPNLGSAPHEKREIG